MASGILAVRSREAIVAPLIFAAALPLLTLGTALLALRRRLQRTAFDPTDAVILITGASSGIGASIARQYARRGARLVLVARTTAALSTLADECAVLGARETVIEPCDVSDVAALGSVIDRTGARFGRIDCVVLNAGISMGVKLAELDDVNVIKRIMDVNYLGCAAGAYHALPHLKRSTQRARIVVVSSLLGFVAGPTRTAYSASKFALKGFFDSLRCEVESDGIEVTMAYPGVVQTNINASRLGGGAVMDIDMRGAMTADEAAEIIVEAVRTGVRDEVFTLQGKFAWILKDLFPLVRDFLARRAMSTVSVSKDASSDKDKKK